MSEPGDIAIASGDNILFMPRSKSEGVSADQTKVFDAALASDSRVREQESLRPLKQSEDCDHVPEPHDPVLEPHDPDPEKLLYPFLNTEGLSENEISNLQGRLTNEYRNITSRYSTLYRDIHSSLTKRGITPKQLAGVLMELSAFALRKSDSKKPLLEDCLDEIEIAEDNQTVFKKLHPYGSFFDCHVIKHIVNSELCTKDDKQKLQEYLSELNDYCRRNVHECPHIATLDPKFTNLVMKVDDIITNKFTMKALHAFRAKVSETLALGEHTLRLCSVEDGCLQLTCQIPPFIKEEVFPLSHQQEERLKSLHIQQLKCDDVVWFIAQTSTLSSPLVKD